MTQKIACFLFIAVFHLGANAVEDNLQSEYLLKQIQNSQEHFFNQTLSRFADRELLGPSADLLLEKCRFVQAAFADPDGEGNPKQELWQTCFDELIRRYPSHLKVICYQIENTYGEKRSEICEGIYFKAIRNGLTGDPRDLGLIYSHLAEYLSGLKRNPESIRLGEMALTASDEAPVRLTLARVYRIQKRNRDAKQVLLGGASHLKGWQAIQAADFLMELGEPKEALVFYERAQNQPNIFMDRQKIAAACEKSGDISNARTQFQLAVSNGYPKTEMTRQYFEFELRHGDGPYSYRAFRSFRDLGFSQDVFSFSRLRLLAKHPLQPVRFLDFTGLFLAVGVILGLLVVPYLWVLPIEAVGRFLTRGKELAETFFQLKHLWLLSTLFLVASFLSLGIFNYPEMVSLFEKYDRHFQAIPGHDAYELLVFILFMAAGGALLLTYAKRWQILKPVMPSRKNLLLSLGLFSILWVVKVINFKLFPELSAELTGQFTQVGLYGQIKSSILYFGFFPTFLLVAILVPIYEELFFRGIILQSVLRYFPFWVANTVQASAFSLLHGEWRLFPFYFAFGVLLGFLFRKTNGFLLPMVIHAVNNALALFALQIFLGQKNH